MTSVTLNPNQIEEAKQMTQGKLRMYRRDRLFTSDKERINCLQECLKNVRITDESAYFNSMKSGTEKGHSNTTPHRNNTFSSKHDRGNNGGGAGAGGGDSHFTSGNKHGGSHTDHKSSGYGKDYSSNQRHNSSKQGGNHHHHHGADGGDKDKKDGQVMTQISAIY